MAQSISSSPSDFIREVIEGTPEDLPVQRTGGYAISTRTQWISPYRTCQSVCLNFGIAAQYKGTCNLRMDDTDPAGESLEYVESIINDVVGWG